VTLPTPNLAGHCDPRFLRVREAFAENFVAHGELGAGVAVYIDGRSVLSLWGGLASRAEQRPWAEDTLVNVYSTTKGLAALCVHHLVDHGKLDLDAPVARLWPEFAAEGKSGITLRMLLGHRAGLPAIRTPLPHAALYEQATMARALAAEAPFWTPNDKHGYHAQTFGFLLAEVVRRATGRTLGAYLREEITGPLGADVHIGLAASDDARVAKITRPAGAAPAQGEPDLVAIFGREPESVTALAFMNPTPSPGAVNTREFRAAEIPASNGHATAEGLARVYATLACGGRALGATLLSAEGVERCHSQQSYGHDEVLRLTTRFGLGFMLSQPSGGGCFSPNAEAFGHPGLGGSIAFADPVARIGFGYVMNRAGTNILVGDRPRRLIDALYESLS
jgi:CubicO group peptidase (beta-lactamase class C family)